MAYRYQYETSPRKLQPEYEPIKKTYPKKSSARSKNTNKGIKNQFFNWIWINSAKWRY